MTKKKVHVMEPDEKLGIYTSIHHIFMPMHTYIHNTHVCGRVRVRVRVCVCVMFQLGIPKSENKGLKEEDSLHLI